ncbi:DUF6046 domain-containing protein [Raineya sp.]
MAELKFNLNDLYQAVFGLKGLPFPLLTQENGYFRAFDKSRADEIISSITGKKSSPYVGQVMNTVRLNDIELPNEPLIELGLSKNIVITEMVNYEGTIKESMGMNDWEVSIRGIIIGEDENSYPISEIQKIRKICETRETVEVICDYLNIFDIFYLAIKSVRFPVFEGAPHIQPYEIQAVSDRIFELLVRDEPNNN